MASVEKTINYNLHILGNKEGIFIFCDIYLIDT